MQNLIVILYKIFSKFHTKISQNFNKIFSCFVKGLGVEPHSLRVLMVVHARLSHLDWRVCSCRLSHWRVLALDGIVRDVVDVGKGPQRDVDVIEALLHCLGDSQGVAHKIVLDVFLKGGNFPSPHLLDLHLAVACESKDIGPAAV